MIVSTSDDVFSSRNHKHLITTIMQIQNCSFVCVMVCKIVITGSWYTQQTHMSLCRCRAVGCYGHRNAVVLYPSPLSVFQSRPGSKQGTNILLYLPWCDTTFCFCERIKKWIASKLLKSETFLPRTSTLSQIPRLCRSNVWATASTLLCCCSWGRPHLGKSTSQNKSSLPRVQGNLKSYPFEAAVV